MTLIQYTGFAGMYKLIGNTVTLTITDDGTIHGTWHYSWDSSARPDFKGKMYTETTGEMV